MNEPLEEDWLDARLREEAVYIDDAGFTARLVQKLPARPAPRSLRGAILLCLTLLAGAATYLASGGGRFLISAVDAFAAMPLWLVCTVAILCAVIATAAAASAAYFQARAETSG